MPAGNPDFKTIRYREPLKAMIRREGEATIVKVLYVIIADFCNSLNVVRNMNSLQITEAAAMLVNECDDFRLEDFAVMFTLGKRGQLVKILDHVDINVIGVMLDEYYKVRRAAGQRLAEEDFNKDEEKYRQRPLPPTTEEEKAMDERWGKLVGQMTAWKEQDDAREETEKAKKRYAQVEGYALLNGIDIEALEKLYPLKKKNHGKSKNRTGNQ